MLLLDAPFYNANPSGTEFFTGTSSVSSLVPDTFHVAINGVPYMLDLNQPFYRQYRRQIAQLIRTQADTGTDPGDQSMDPNSLWRRSYEDWSLGAGQRYLDRAPNNSSNGAVASFPNAFWSSKGIDALTTKWQLSLLPDVMSLRSSANTNLQVVLVGALVYLIDGNDLLWNEYASGSWVGWTTVTGTPGGSASSVCTDGFNVWVAYGADGIYTTTAGTSIATQYVTDPVDVSAILGYCNGRLMLASTNIIYNIVGSGVLPSPLFTAGNPGMTFCGFAEGDGAIYAGATTTSRSWIYGMTVTTDGTALGAPVVQGALPSGETTTSVFGYLSFLMVGTTAGVRMCSTSTSGSVTLGALIPTVIPVGCLAGWGRWVWFGLSEYDDVSSGIGKIDLENQVVSGVLPAWCSDLMATSQGEVLSVAAYPQTTDAGLTTPQFMLFTVGSEGVYVTDPTTLVPSGTYQSGYVLYDLSDNKVACLLDVQSLAPQVGSFAAYVSTDAGPFAPVGVHAEDSTTFLDTFGVGPVTGQRFEVQLQLVRDVEDATVGPTITRWTLRAYPAPRRPLTWQLPLILNEETVNRSSGSDGFDPLSALQALEMLATTAQVVAFQEGNVTYPVFVQDVEFLPDYTMENRRNSYFNGIALVTLVGLPAQV